MEFESWLKSEGLTPTDKQLKQFELYYDFLIEKNKVMNLTAITEKDEVYLKHFIDSLYLKRAVKLDSQHFLDVGSGAGFPSLPLKIMFPELKITIIDSLQKRIVFLQELVALLGLKDVRLIHGRIEEFKEKETFDIVSARALAKLNILTEFCLPFVKKQGYFIAMKSIHYEDELNESKHSIDALGGYLEKPIVYSLSSDLSHVLIPIKKVFETDSKYPRNFGAIQKRPL